MNGLRSYMTSEKPSSLGRFFDFEKQGQRGNALLYVLLAVGLLAALTYYFVQDSNENYASENAIHISEELYAQINMIKSAVVECTLEYPAGGGDLNGDGVINTSDNPNNPYPLNPSSTLNPNAPAGIAAASNDDVSNLTCVGAPAGYARMFSGSSNQGRYLPPPPTGFSAWTYTNDSTGVYLQITAPSDPSAIDALDRLMNRFTATQAVHGTGSTSFKVWIKNNT